MSGTINAPFSNPLRAAPHPKVRGTSPRLPGTSGRGAPDSQLWGHLGRGDSSSSPSSLIAQVLRRITSIYPRHGPLPNTAPEPPLLCSLQTQSTTEKPSKHFETHLSPVQIIASASPGVPYRPLLSTPSDSPPQACFGYLLASPWLGFLLCCQISAVSRGARFLFIVVGPALFRWRGPLSRPRAAAWPCIIPFRRHRSIQLHSCCLPSTPQHHTDTTRTSANNTSLSEPNPSVVSDPTDENGVTGLRCSRYPQGLLEPRQLNCCSGSERPWDCDTISSPPDSSQLHIPCPASARPEGPAPEGPARADRLGPRPAGRPVRALSVPVSRLRVRRYHN